MSGHDEFTNEPIGLTKEQTRNKEVNQGKRLFPCQKNALVIIYHPTPMSRRPCLTISVPGPSSYVIPAVVGLKLANSSNEARVFSKSEAFILTVNPLNVTNFIPHLTFFINISKKC